jgi:hypothetical protein
MWIQCNGPYPCGGRVWKKKEEESLLNLELGPLVKGSIFVPYIITYSKGCWDEASFHPSVLSSICLIVHSSSPFVPLSICPVHSSRHGLFPLTGRRKQWSTNAANALTYSKGHRDEASFNPSIPSSIRPVMVCLLRWGGENSGVSTRWMLWQNLSWVYHWHHLM